MPLQTSIVGVHEATNSQPPCSFTVVSRPSPDEARQRYCFAWGVWLVQALAHHYITLHNLLATGETRSSVSVVSAWGMGEGVAGGWCYTWGCVMTRPGAKVTGVMRATPSHCRRAVCLVSGGSGTSNYDDGEDFLGSFFYFPSVRFTFNDLTSQSCV